MFIVQVAFEWMIKQRLCYKLSSSCLSLSTILRLTWLSQDKVFDIGEAKKLESGWLWVTFFDIKNEISTMNLDIFPHFV